VTLRQLQYFARIVELGNITRAAEQLHVAQPALGLQIRQLEEELGVRLLSRHSRGVSPTRAGRLLYERACDVLRLLEETGREVTALGRHEREGIVLGLTNGFANIVGRDLVLQARRDLPGVELSLVEERSVILVDALERHEIDIALAYEVHERPGLLRIPLLEEETLFVAAPQLVPRPPPRRRTKGSSARSAKPAGKAAGTSGHTLDEPMEFADLARYPLVMPGPRDGVRQQVLATAKRLALDLDVILDVSSVSMMKNMVARGDATAVMPYGNVFDEIAAGRIVGRRIANPPLKRTLYLVRAMRRAPFAEESGVLRLLADASQRYVEALGALATPLPALERGALLAAVGPTA
jgi:LysR family nitrogen assimilation transcriptional regulator